MIWSSFCNSINQKRVWSLICTTRSSSSWSSNCRWWAQFYQLHQPCSCWRSQVHQLAQASLSSVQSQYSHLQHWARTLPHSWHPILQLSIPKPEGLATKTDGSSFIINSNKQRKKHEHSDKNMSSYLRNWEFNSVFRCSLYGNFSNRVFNGKFLLAFPA